MAASTPSIWEKIDYAIAAQPNPLLPQRQSVSPSKKPNSFASRLRWRFMDAVAVSLWLYVGSTLLIFDINARLSKLSPILDAIIQYRFFVALAILSILAVTWRLKSVFALAYIAGFPLVVIAWKLPKFLIDRRSWTLTLGVLHIIFAGFWGFKKGLLGFTTFAFACLAVSLEARPFLCVAVVLTSALLLYSYTKAFQDAFKPTRFMSTQVKFFSSLAQSNITADTWRIKPELRASNVEKFDRMQLETFKQGLLTGTMVYYGANFWAYKIEKYRQSPASVFFAATALLWLIGASIANLTIMNLAAYKLAPEEFSVDQSGVSVSRFIYYSFAALYVNEISGLTPNAGLPLLIKIVAGLLGAVLLTILLVTIYMSFRSERHNREAQEAVAALQARAAEFEEELKKEYEVSAEEALVRLQEMQQGATTILHYIAQNIPSEFYPRTGGASPDN